MLWRRMKQVKGTESGKGVIALERGHLVKHYHENDTNTVNNQFQVISKDFKSSNEESANILYSILSCILIFIF